MTETVAGLSIPFRIGADGRVAPISGAEKIRENLAHILLTRTGERPMRRDVGGGLHELLHDPDDDVLRALLRHRLAAAVARWEPRVGLTAIGIERRNDLLVVDLTYVRRGGDQPETLSVPVAVATQ